MANGENHYKSWSNMKKIAKKYLLFDNGKFKPYTKLKKYSFKLLTKRTRNKYGLYKVWSVDQGWFLKGKSQNKSQRIIDFYSSFNTNYAMVFTKLNILVEFPPFFNFFTITGGPIMLCINRPWMKEFIFFFKYRICAHERGEDAKLGGVVWKNLFKNQF